VLAPGHGHEHFSAHGDIEDRVGSCRLVIGTIVNYLSAAPSSFNPPLPFFLAKSGESRSGELGGKVSSRRILVIDDEVSIADSLVEILSSHGFDARAFYGGQGAVDFARKQCPDIVLSD